MIDAQIGNDPLNLPRRDTLEVGFGDCIHQIFLHLGRTSKDLGFKGNSRSCGFRRMGFLILGFEGSVLVVVSMRLPRIGALIWIGSRLLERLLEHHLVEELGDESFHTILLVGVRICDKR